MAREIDEIERRVHHLVVVSQERMLEREILLAALRNIVASDDHQEAIEIAADVLAEIEPPPAIDPAEGIDGISG